MLASRYNNKVQVKDLNPSHSSVVSLSFGWCFKPYAIKILTDVPVDCSASRRKTWLKLGF